MIKNIWILSLALCLFSTSSAFAQTKRSQPLFFPAEKNNLQILPQRFEYSLLDNDRLKIGDVLIDTRKITVRIEPTGNKKTPYRAYFTWPTGLIKEGELAIKSNSGKAVFKVAVNSKDAVAATEGTDEEPATRSGLATHDALLSADLIEDMKYFPFMVLCIYRESAKTRLYLCSQELYLSDKKEAYEILPRKISEKVSQIDINGQVVGNKGLIYLNNSSEDVAFKANTKTGAFLEIETRRKDVDFKDIIITEDGKRLVVTASGAEPVDAKRVRRISQYEWQIALSAQRPLLYMKGDGDIPMRQEFNILGPLPKSKSRPRLTGKSFEQTYASNVRITGVLPASASLSLPADDTSSELVATDSGFTWTLKDLVSDQENRRFLQLQNGPEKNILGYDIFKGRPFTLRAGAEYYTPSSAAFAHLEFQWWIENFLGMSSSWSRFHWGLSLSRDQNILKSDDLGQMDFTTLELLWRADAGLDFIDGSWGLSVPMQMIDTEAGNINAYGLGAYWMKKSQAHPALDWFKLSGHYFMGSSGDTVKLSSAMLGGLEAYKALSSQTYLHYGVKIQMYKFDPAGKKEEIQAGLQGGLTYKF